MRFDTVTDMGGLCALIESVGFLPFFANNINGFSLEECIAPELWYSADSDEWAAWEWKGPVIQKTGCAYGSFFRGRAGFISSELYPDFANYRRDGYDFDARYEDGLARYSDKEVYDLLISRGSALSAELKKSGGFGGRNGKKGFESIITRLQMQGYIVTADFERRVNKRGEPYGWGTARYTTPETFFGAGFTDRVYTSEPEDSLKKIVKHLSGRLSGTPEEDILRLIK